MFIRIVGQLTISDTKNLMNWENEATLYTEFALVIVGIRKDDCGNRRNQNVEGVGTSPPQRLNHTIRLRAVGLH